MPPPASKRRTSSKSFDRIEGEGPKAFAAFAIYRDMGPDRTLAAVLDALGKASGYSRMLEEWSSDWNWVERARAWDNMLAAKAREVAEGYIPVWEQRRQDALERMMLFSAKLFARAEAMLDHPIVKEVTRETEDGRTIYNIIEPAGWTWSGLATVVRTAAELQTATIAEGLMVADEDSFDVESATEDELRGYLRRAKARRGPRGATI
jgi:hypothetical protein